MAISIISLTGFAAGFLTTIALMPQAWKAYKTKSTHDVSLGWISTLTVGVVLWLIYGFMIDSMPVIFANFFTLILALVVFYFKIRYH